MKKALKILALLIIGLVIIGLSWSGYQHWQSAQDAEAIKGTPQGQLPKWAHPTDYDLSLTIDPMQSDYQGKVIIGVEMLIASDHIWLHGSDFDIEYAQWRDDHNKAFPASYEEIGHSGVVKFGFGKKIAAQHLTLEIAFERSFENDLAGLYKVESKKGANIFTQFEATDARKAFPGFDEPRFKVPFTYHLTVPKSLVALTNTPESKRTEHGDMITFDYQTTKPLPTYLVAFAVGDFEMVDAGTLPANMYRDYPLPIKAWAVKSKGEKLGYAAKHTAEIVEALETYFGRGYPYKKLDFIAVPDFAAGAMENAGLITYREQILLIGDKPTLNEQRRYLRVHAHELAHQWFGNLVTMPWWNDIWLNESFANWMEGKITAKLRPDLRSGEDDISSVHGVMTSDSYMSARQIREPIKTNGDIDNAFDGITYTKGGGVLNMFEKFIGEEAFRRGVQYHLKRFEWGNATAKDFIQSMAKSTNKQQLVSAFMSFLEQPGVPLVNMDWSCTPIGGNSDDTSQDDAAKTNLAVASTQYSRLNLKLSQSRYLPLGINGDPDMAWQIPMCVSAINDDKRNDFCFMLDRTEAEYNYPVKQCPQIISPNKDAAGYYRWSLDKDKWQLLAENLNQLNAAERISFNSNLFAELKAGQTDATTVISAAKAFAALPDEESKLLPISSLEFLAEYVADANEKTEMSRYLKSLYGDLMDSLGFDANTELDKKDSALAAKIRNRLLNLFAIKLKDKRIREILSKRAIAYSGFGGDNKIHDDAINPDLATLAMSVAVQEKGKPYFDYLEQKLEQSEDGTLRGRLLSAMSATTDPALSERILGKVISTDTRLNEKGIMIFGQMSMPETRDKTYRWFKDKYGLISMFIPQKYLSYAPRIGMAFCDQQHLDDLNAFFKDEIEPGSAGERQLATTVEIIASCAAVKASIQSVEVPKDIN